MRTSLGVASALYVAAAAGFAVASAVVLTTSKSAAATFGVASAAMLAGAGTSGVRAFR